MCILINTVKLVSVIYFGVGIGLLGAIDFISRKKIPLNNAILLVLQVLSTLMISLSLLNEVHVIFVFSLFFGMCIFYILYNLKNANKISTTILAIISCFFIDIAFLNVLNIYRFLLFTICIIAYFTLIYIKKPCSN